MSQLLADAVLKAAQAKSVSIGVPMNIAVLDESANLKAFIRMDGALLGSTDIALRKARTAALFGMNTEAIGEFCRPGGTSPGLEATNGGLVVFAGGIPINDSRGNLLGAVGVSGGSVEQDFEVATAAVDSAYRVGDPEWSSAVLEDQRSSLQAYAARS
jgi:uncharacterized protein GlcG (DUF336 family)